MSPAQHLTEDIPAQPTVTAPAALAPPNASIQQNHKESALSVLERLQNMCRRILESLSSGVQS